MTPPDRYRETKSGKRVTPWTAEAEVKRARSTFDLGVRRWLVASKHDDLDIWSFHLEHVEMQLEVLEGEVTLWRELLECEQARVRKREQIVNLRNTTGRSPAEAAEFLRKADELEATITDESKGNTQ